MNASRKSEYRILVEKETAWYMERLDRYKQQERVYLEKAGFIPPKRIRYRKATGPKQVEKAKAPRTLRLGC